MARPVGIDVLDGLADTVYDTDRQAQVEVLFVPVLLRGCGNPAGGKRSRSAVAAQLTPGGQQGLAFLAIKVPRIGNQRRAHGFF